MAEPKPRIREVIVVEGRYDRNALSQVVDALIFETGGFSIFHDPEKVRALRMLAEERGVILLTDPDGAGFVIRNRLKSMLPPDRVRQAFIPAIPGKERRKDHASQEGLLGVEGMTPDALLTALRAAGVCEEHPDAGRPSITTSDFYALGLTGSPDSAERRRKLAASLGLPAAISQSDLRKYLSARMTPDELRTLLAMQQEV